jgi:hypothetical protein
MVFGVVEDHSNGQQPLLAVTALDLTATEETITWSLSVAEMSALRR